MMEDNCLRMTATPFVLDIEFKGEYGEFGYKTKYSAGADIPSQEMYVLHPGETQLIATGLYLKAFNLVLENDAGERKLLSQNEIPEDLHVDWLPELQIRPRSGLSARGINCAFGTVDADFRGEIKVCLTNLSQKTYVVNRGERVAQLVAAVVMNVRCINRSAATRDGGFGSTGV
jgi:deoxyuridine 5'-triphosphate nucleotidohydrolase